MIGTEMLISSETRRGRTADAKPCILASLSIFISSGRLRASLSSSRFERARMSSSESRCVGGENAR